MRAHTFDVLICSNILLICSHSFWKIAATILNLQQLYLICSNFILFAATFFNLQQHLFHLQQRFLICSNIYFICSNFLICSISLVGHPNSTIVGVRITVMLFEKKKKNHRFISCWFRYCVINTFLLILHTFRLPKSLERLCCCKLPD